MGFRSTFTTQDYAITWPQWFLAKYARHIWFTDHGSGPLHSRREAKTYMTWAELPTDIQKVLNEVPFAGKFVLVYLHECGGITRCQIARDSIKWSEPDTWRITKDVEHDYCYGCSDVGGQNEDSLE